MLGFPSWKFSIYFKYLFIMSSKSKRKFSIHQQKREVYYNHKMFESEALLHVTRQTWTVLKQKKKTTSANFSTSKTIEILTKNSSGPKNTHLAIVPGWIMIYGKNSDIFLLLAMFPRGGGLLGWEGGESRWRVLPSQLQLKTSLPLKALTLLCPSVLRRGTIRGCTRHLLGPSWMCPKE